MGGNAIDLSDLEKDTQIAALRSEVDGLHQTMEHRAVIEQAKGVLMHSMHIGPEAAFAVLVAASMRENVKLRTIATRIVEAQERPPAADAGLSSL